MGKFNCTSQSSLKLNSSEQKGGGDDLGLEIHFAPI